MWSNRWQHRETVQAVYDDDLLAVLESLGLIQSIEAGELLCVVCGTVMTIDNIQGIFPLDGEVRLFCDHPDCTIEVLLKLQGRHDVTGVD